MSLAGCGGSDGDIDAQGPSAKAGAALAEVAGAPAAATDAAATPGSVATTLESAGVEAALWVPLATEYMPFDLAEPTTVRYGALDRWVERHLPAGPGMCTNEFFGTDPLPGVTKRCEASVDTPPPPPSGSWVFVSEEWQTFTLASAARVRYGVNGIWIERDLRAGQASCTNDFFGADPVPGVRKRCEVLQAASPPPPPSAGSWVTASREWQDFNLATPARVRYGIDGSWIERDLPAGPVSCTNDFFGADPRPGVTKRCEVWVPSTAGSWVFASNEWQSFNLASARRVRYGANGVWIERDVAAGEVFCTNTFFGADPVPGVTKRCEVWEPAGSPPPPPPPPAAPAISSFSPTSGPVSTVVVVTGSGFAGVTGASIGGAAATFEIVSATEVRVRVPAGAQTGRIVLSAGSTAAVSLADFTVTQAPQVPTVTSVTPTTVAPGGQLTVAGTSLDQVASARLGASALSIVSQTTTRLVLALPPGAVSGTLVLVDRTGVARDAASIQVLVPMTVSGFSPTIVTRGQTLTITGQGLDRVATVRFVAGAVAPVASRSGSTSIAVTVPNAAQSGRVTLIATQGDEVTSGTDVTIVDPVTVASQVHRVGVGGTVTVTGTGFERVRSVLLGANEVGIKARSSTSIAFTVPAGVVCADITLRLDDGGSVAAGSVMTGGDCGARTAGIEFAQLLSQPSDDPRLRLAAGKETWIRAFVVATTAGTPAPSVRVQGIDGGGALLGTLTMSGPPVLPVLAPGQSVPDSLRMNDDNTFRAELPTAWIQPGLRLRVEAGPSAAEEVVPRIVDSGGIRVVLVPLWSGPYGPTMPGAVDAQQLVTSRFPMAADRIVVSIRAPYNLSSVTGGVSTSSQWSAALSELEALRAREAPTTLYYGLVQPRVSSGIAGIGYVNSIGSSFPALSALGWDATRTSWKTTLVHELGHNFSRYHAPCGGVGNPDPAYPYPGGAIGPNPVFDPRTDVVGGIAGQYDVMGYCNGTFFSDYNLAGVKAFLEARPGGTKLVTAESAEVGGAPEWLVISGTVAADGAWVRSVRAVTDPTEAPAPGDRRSGLTMRLTTRAGAVITHSIEAVPLDHVDDESHFTLRVASPGPLRRLEILRDGRVIHTRDSAAASAGTQAKAARGSTPASVRAVNGDWVVAWDAAEHPQASLVFVIGNSRRVLALDAEGGRWTVPAAMLQGLPAGGRLELSLSNGIDTLLLKLARP